MLRRRDWPKRFAEWIEKQRSARRQPVGVRQPGLKCWEGSQPLRYGMVRSLDPKALTTLIETVFAAAKGERLMVEWAKPGLLRITGDSGEIFAQIGARDTQSSRADKGFVPVQERL